MGRGSHGALERLGSGLENASHRRERTPTDQGKGHVLTSPPPPPPCFSSERRPRTALLGPAASQEAAHPPSWRNLAAHSFSGKQLQFLGSYCPASRQALLTPWAARPGDTGPQRTPSFPVCFSLTLAQASRGFWEPRPLLRTGGMTMSRGDRTVQTNRTLILFPSLQLLVRPAYVVCPRHSSK